MLLITAAARRRRALQPPLVRLRGACVARLQPSAMAPVAVGRLLLCGAFLIAGFGGVLAKSAYAAGATPVSFLLMRLATAVVVLAVLTRSDLLRPGGRRIARLVALGTAFGAQTLAYYSAMEIAPVGLVVVVVSTYPIIVITLDAVAARRPPPPSRLAAMGLSLVGLWVAAGNPTGRPDAGVLLALCSAVGYAMYLRLSATALAPGGDGVTPGVPPMVATAWVMAGALAVIAVVAVLSPPPLPETVGIGLAVLHGAVATALPIVAVYAALLRLTTSQLAALGPLEPIVATAVAGAVLGETLTFTQVIGICVVLLAVAQLSGVLTGARPRAALPRLPFSVAQAHTRGDRRSAAGGRRAGVARRTMPRRDRRLRLGS